jgi:hypothetical protein
MKPRHPNLEWMRKVLADLERDRGNPQIAALMDRQIGDHQASALAEASSPSVRGVETSAELLESAPAHFKP